MGHILQVWQSPIIAIWTDLFRSQTPDWPERPCNACSRYSRVWCSGDPGLLSRSITVIKFVISCTELKKPHLIKKPELNLKKSASKQDQSHLKTALIIYIFFRSTESSSSSASASEKSDNRRTDYYQPSKYYQPTPWDLHSHAGNTYYMPGRVFLTGNRVPS